MDIGVPIPFAQRLSRRQWLALDVVVAVVVAVLTIFVPVEGHDVLAVNDGWDVAIVVVIIVGCALLPFRRRWPLPVLIATSVAVGSSIAAGVRGPLPILVALCLYTVAVDPEVDGSVCAVAAATIVVGLFVTELLGIGTADWGPVISAPVVVFATWLAGMNARTRRVYARELATRAREQVDERVERATNDERLRIARELHDVLAHSMSLIAVRSGVSRMVIDTQPEEAAEGLAIIEATSRRALAELRVLVTVLRAGDSDPAELAPAPGLADLPILLDQVRDAGVTVEFHTDGEPQSLDPGVDVSAYRIVQEALTNVVRHAGSATAHLRVSYSPEEVEIEVNDDGNTNGAASAPGLIGAGGGHGLVGMRERVAAYGGDFVAGPTEHGFRVLARLRTRDTDS